MEEGNNWFGRTIKKLTQKPPEEKDTAEKMQELRQELLAVRKAADKYANSSRSDYIWEEGKPFLPDTIVLKNVGNKYDLVSTAHARAEELWGSNERVFPESTDQLAIDRYVWQEGDTISVSRKLLKEDSYIVLFVPKYFSVTNHNIPEERTGNHGYDITVLYCQNKNKVIKLMSMRELGFREDRLRIDAIHTEPEFRRDFEKDPLPHPKKEIDYYQLLRPSLLKTVKRILIYGLEIRLGLACMEPTLIVK